jgi:hypothetical protein
MTQKRTTFGHLDLTIDPTANNSKTWSDLIRPSKMCPSCKHSLALHFNGRCRDGLNCRCGASE